MMQTTRKRIFAILLIIIGIAAFLFGAWLLYSLFFGDGDGGTPNLPQAGNDLNVTARDVEPQTYEAPVVVEGDSNFDETTQGTDVTEALNKASSVVSRMGSGTSQDGFLGYNDVMVDATPRFQAYLASEQLRMQQEYPMAGDLFGITVRSIATKLLDGEEGSNEIKVEVQTQKAIDAGNRANPVEVIYEKHEVTLVRQANGEYLVDFIQTEELD